MTSHDDKSQPTPRTDAARDFERKNSRIYRGGKVEELCRELELELREAYKAFQALPSHERTTTNTVPQASVAEGSLTAAADRSRGPESDESREGQAPAHPVGSVHPDADPDAEDLPGRKDRDRGHGPAALSSIAAPGEAAQVAHLLRKGIRKWRAMKEDKGDTEYHILKDVLQNWPLIEAALLAPSAIGPINTTVAPPPIWDGRITFASDCCMDGNLIKAGTVRKIGSDGGGA